MATQEEMVTEWSSQRRRSRYFGKKPRLLVNGEVVMSDFVDAKRYLTCSFPNLHNNTRSVALVNIPVRIRKECIDTFTLSCGFLDFSFFWIFFKGELVLADRSPTFL